MAKSAWKFLKTNRKQIYMYITEFKRIREKKGQQAFGLVKKSFLINNINYMHTYNFMLGDSYTSKKFYPQCIGYRGTMFLKYKKPVHYFSKKKKKINVKKN